jgi:phosphoglucosamine mutase
MRRYFGTDGVRGIVGEELTVDLVESLGRAYAIWAGGPEVLVGRDTRASGPELEQALAAGLASGGSNVLLGGVLPTPAVALLGRESGAVVSASHNPPEYNGVKLFRSGAKLTDGQEEEIEALLDRPGPGGGSILEQSGLGARYLDLVCERFGRPLDGLRVALDCANGAMSQIAPEAFTRLGARVVVTVGDAPDGSNINDGCGATDLTLLAGIVAAEAVDIGIAFDGDGDRMLAVDAAGSEVDGDQIVAILAVHLGVDLVAVTSMTNLGFHRHMEARGIRVVTTDVGDRYVLEALHREGGVLGGEQSGHILYLDGHVSGDGLVAALLLCGALADSGQALAEAAAAMPRLPQAKANVRVSCPGVPATLRARVAELNAGLRGRGRVLVRPSGTEPVVRILAEAESAAECERLRDDVRDLVEQELG